MSFIRFRLGVGKQVELWDSNVHKDIQVALPETAGPKDFSIKVLSFIDLPKKRLSVRSGIHRANL